MTPQSDCGQLWMAGGIPERSPTCPNIRLSPIHRPYNYNNKILLFFIGRPFRGDLQGGPSEVPLRARHARRCGGHRAACRRFPDRCDAGAVGLAGRARPATPSSWWAPTSSSPSGCASLPTARATAPRWSRRGCSRRSCRSSTPARCASSSPTTRPRSSRAASRRHCARSSASEFPRLPEASTEGGVRVDAARVRRRAAPGGLRLRRATTPARSSPVCSSPRAGGLRLVATDSYRLGAARPRGRERARRGPEGAGRGEGPGRGAATPARVPRQNAKPAARSRSCWASATWCSASGTPRSPRG